MVQNAFIQANKLRRYGPIVAHSQADIKTRTQHGHWIMILCTSMLIRQVTHPGLATRHFHFPGFRHFSNGCAHEISCQAA